MSKLSGQEYLDFWHERMRHGPSMVSHCGEEPEAQGDFYFAQMLPFLPNTAGRVLEFGSGYGRMLQRLRTRYPDAVLMGVDLSSDALRGSWYDDNTWLMQHTSVPLRIRSVDLVLTCTVLQHITDDAMLAAATASLAHCLRRGGRIIMLENVARPRAPHVRECGPEDYMAAFPAGAIQWEADPGKPPICEWRGETHAIMAGVKR